MKTIQFTKLLLLKLMLPFVGLAFLGMTSCATMHGFGDDVETAGEEIQEAAH